MIVESEFDTRHCLNTLQFTATKALLKNKKGGSIVIRENMLFKDNGSLIMKKDKFDSLFDNWEDLMKLKLVNGSKVFMSPREV